MTYNRISTNDKCYARTLWTDRHGDRSVANKTLGIVYLMPLHVPCNLTIDRLGYVADPALAGNIRMGLYRSVGDAPDGGVLLVETPSTATAQPSKREITIPRTRLTRGLYWIAILKDQTNAMVCEQDYANAGGTLFGRSYNLAFGALTNPCPATAARQECPWAYVRVAT